MTEQRILAVATASGRIGIVFMVGDALVDWGISNKGGEAPAETDSVVQSWIDRLSPNVVVTERFLVEGPSHKGEKSRFLSLAVAATAKENGLLTVQIARPRLYANKYEEAEHLAEKFPDIAGWLPERRRVWDNEPRNTVLFEALSLAEELRRGGSIALAAALG